MLAVVGTVPDERLPVIDGDVSLIDSAVLIKGNKIPIGRGTAALLAAAIKVKDFFGKPQPYAFLAGDTGKGKGSKALYEFLTQRLRDTDFDTIVFHYIQPDVDLHNKVLFTIQEMKKRPKLIADAGFMYVAKMSG
ncbi:MAG: sugar kinase, partial [Deltaproteobacteria bacterium]